jgi:hypothetical protein
MECSVAGTTTLDREWRMTMLLSTNHLVPNLVDFFQLLKFVIANVQVIGYFLKSESNLDFFLLWKFITAVQEE